MSPFGLSPEDDGTWLRREAVLDRFEAAWQEHGEAAIADFLPPPESEDRRPLLLELIKIDLEYRWRRGQQTGIEEYTCEFPELLVAGCVPEELLREVEALRQKQDCGPTPTHSEAASSDQGRETLQRGDAALATPPDGPPRCEEQTRSPVEFIPPRRVGRYDVHEALGRGGFATVYRGWDSELRRTVAIKVPHPTLIEDTAAANRLVREASSAARLRHPALVPIHEVGREPSCPYIVYEFLPGPTLSRLLRETVPAPQQAAEWVARLAEAVAYAHSQGIIHRDIKPGNVLLDRDGRPVLADFGLALQLDASARLTRTGDILGTPAYMAPEQAAGRGSDARTDIYGLGGLLYELLAGRAPFEGTGPSVLHRVLHDEPAPPRRYRAGVPADLETICLKAMAKEPGRRYATAGELAEDLHRWLEHRPIRARRVGPVGRLIRWCRRQPALAAAVLTVAVVASVGFWRVVAERDRYRREEERAVANLYESLVREARALRLARGAGYREEVWKRLHQALQLDTPARDLLALRSEAVACLGDFVGLEPVTWDRITPNFDYLVALAIHPGGRLVACGLTDRTVSLRQLPDGEEKARLRGHRSGVFAVAFTPDGQRLVSMDDQGEVRIWEAATSGWTSRQTLVTDASRQPGMVTAVSICITPDGRFLLTCPKGATAVSVWDLADGRLAARLETGGADHLVRLALSRDGRFLFAAVRAQAEGLIVWDLATRTLLRRVSLAPDTVLDLAASPDGQLLACATVNGVLVLDTAEFQRRLFVRGDYVYGIAFSPDGQHLAIPSNHFQLVRLWNVVVNREVATLPHLGEPHTVAFTPDGSRLLSMTARSVRTWQLDGSGDKRVLAGHTSSIARLAFSPDGKFLVSGGGPEVKFWDPTTGNLLHTLGGFSGPVQCVALNSDASLLATADSSGALRIWTVRSPQSVRLLQDLTPGVGMVQLTLLFSPAGDHVAACGERGVRLWRIARSLRTDAPWTFHELPSPTDQPCYGLCFALNGKLLARLDRRFGATIRLWDLERGQETLSLAVHEPGAPFGLAFSPDSRHLLAIGEPHEVETWEVHTGQRVSTFGKEQAAPSGYFYQRALTLTPDGAWLAAHGPSVVTVWDRVAGKLLLVLPQERSHPQCSAWTADRERLAIGSADGSLVLWNLPVIRAELRRLGLDW